MMFTGLVEEIGKIVSIERTNFGKRLIVQAEKIIEDLKIGDSVAINGVCQTAVAINSNRIVFDTVYETLKKTTLGFFIAGSKVNLERSLTLQSRFGGHFVQGHVDTRGRITQINKNQDSAEIYIYFSREFRKFLANTGSICVDGISLTTAEIFDTSFKLAIIPQTLNSTISSNYKVGDEVNLEFDIIGKYVHSALKHGSNISNLASENIINQSNYF